MSRLKVTLYKIGILGIKLFQAILLVVSILAAELWSGCKHLYHNRERYWAAIIRHKALSYIVSTIIGVLLLCAIVVSKFEYVTPRSWHIDELNSLITNEMSNFEQTKTFDKTIETFMRKWCIKGGTFALMRNDSLIYAKGYGYVDVDREVKCEVKNTFRLASASKLITAAAVMKLVEEGKLSLKSKVFGEGGILNDPKFLQLKDRNMKLITVEHLLRHTAGFSTPIEDPAFGNYSVSRALDTELPLSVDDMVLYSTMWRLRARPGDRYDYSNLGYIILGKVVEVVSGKGYEQYVQETLLEPAGCYHMYIGANWERDRDRSETKYYEVKEAEKIEACDGSGKRTLRSNGGNNVTLLSSAGGWVASSVELLRFVAAINGHSGKADILSKESVRAMTADTNQKPMGWATVRGSYWYRSGSMAGTCTMIKRQPDGYTWVFISNSSAWIAYHLSDKISYEVSRAISRVKRWPKRDLFDIVNNRSAAELDEAL